MSIGYIQSNTLYLAGAGTIIGATSIVLTSLKDIYGNVLTMADFGSKGFITLEPDTNNEEAATFTGVTSNSNGTYTLTGVKTGLAKPPYTETSGLIRQHSGGTKVVITDNVEFWSTFANKQNDETITGRWGSATVPSSGNDYANKTYVDGVAIAGAPNASSTVKGISKLSTNPVSPTDPIAVGDNDTRMPTQGEKDAMIGTSGTAPSTSNAFVDLNDTSVTSVASKVVRGNASGKIDSSWLESGILQSYVSGENLTQGKPIYMNPSDSSLYTSHGFKELDSTSWNVTPSGTSKVAKLSDTQSMFLTSATTTLTITVYNINSASSVATQTVTTSFDQSPTVSTNNLPSATVCRLSDTTFIVFYTKTTNNALYFRTGTISGATITMDTETAYTGSPTYCFGLDAVPGASDGKVVFGYFDSTVELGAGSSTVDMKLAYLTCSANTATVTYSTSYQQTSAAYFATPIWSSVAFTRNMAYGIYCCSDSGGINQIKYNYISVIDGTVSNGNYTNNLEMPTGAGVSSAYTSYLPYVVGHNGSIYFGWQIYDGGTGINTNTKTILKASTSGCRVFYQVTYINGAGDTTVSAIPMFGNDMGVIATGFITTDSGSYYNGSIYIQKDIIYPFYSGDTLGTRSSAILPRSSYSNSKDEIIVSFPDTSGFIKQWKIPTLINGFAYSTVTAPTATYIVQNGITSGLTANAKYYLKDTYTTTGDISVSGTIPVGQAISTTVITSI